MIGATGDPPQALELLTELTRKDQRWIRICREIVQDSGNGPPSATAIARISDPNGSDLRALQNAGQVMPPVHNPQIRYPPDRIWEFEAATSIGYLTRRLVNDDLVDNSSAAPLLNYCSEAYLVSVGHTVGQPGSLTPLIDHVQARKKPPPAAEHLLEILDQLNTSGSPAAPYVGLLACHLANVLPPERATSEVRVLFDTTGRSALGEGATGTLTLTLLAAGPPGLHPHPHAMAFFRADSDFTKALDSAWTYAADVNSDRAVLWDLALDQDNDGPPSYATGESLGAAFGVALYYLAQHNRKPRAIGRIITLDYRSKITNRNAAITARVDDIGNLQDVQLGTKIDAANRAGLATVIVAPTSEDDARKLAKREGHTHRWKVKIKTAQDIPAAADLSHAANPHYKLTLILTAIAAAILAIVLIAGIAITLNIRTNNEQQALNAAAAKAKRSAESLADGDINGTALLLAMASDDLTAKAQDLGSTEHHPSGGTFQALQWDRYSTLRQVVHSAKSDFTGAVMAPDDRTAWLLSTGGKASLVDTSTGYIVWSMQVGTGLNINPGVGTTAAAFSADSGTAAMGGSDGSIRVLRKHGSSWRLVSAFMISESVPAFDPEESDRDVVKDLALNDDGTRLWTVNQKTGLRSYDIGKVISDRGSTPPDDSWFRVKPATKCPKLTSGKITYSGRQLAMLVGNRAVAVTADCRTTTLLRLPMDFKPHDLQNMAGSVTVVGTRGNDLLAETTHGTTMVGRTGPYNDVHAHATRARGLVVTASNSTETLAFAVGDTDTATLLSTRRKGALAVGSDQTLLVNGTDAAIHSLDATNGLGRTNTRISANQPQEIAWAGSRLVVLTPAGPTITKTTTDGTLGEPEPLKTGDSCRNESWSQLAVSPSGRWVAATGICAANNGLSAYLWDLDGGPAPVGQLLTNDKATLLTFVNDQTLLAATLSTPGGVRSISRFVFKDSWTFVMARQMRQPIWDLVTEKSGTVLGITAASSKTEPTVQRFDPVSLDTVATTDPLDGLTGVAHLVALPDGRSVAGTGNGTIFRLSRDLHQVDQQTISGVAYFLGLEFLPRNDSLLVTTPTRNYLLDPTTLAVTPATWAGGSFTIAALSPDGHQIALGSRSKHTISPMVIDPTDLRARACEAIGRDLTVMEWSNYVSIDITQSPVCPGHEPTGPNSYQNEQHWVVSPEGVGPLKLNLTLGSALAAGLMSAGSADNSGCTDYRLAGDWSDRGVAPQFEDDVADGRLLSIWVRSSRFRTENGSGVGDTLTTLKERYGSSLQFLDTYSSDADGTNKEPVVMSDEGALVFDIDSDDAVAGMNVVRLHRNGTIERYVC